MKHNKYLIFASIGFELVILIWISLWIGKSIGGQTAQAFCVLGAFLIWFISLILKLKGMKNKDD